MPGKQNELEGKIRKAVRQFWLTRQYQSEKQGEQSGEKDRGARAAVTGGAHLDGFAQIVQSLILEAGLQEGDVFRRRSVELPGYYRAEKKWDLVVVVDGRLLATVEFKAQVGTSFGNNYNNRSEEALGSATDFWAAYREGAFKGSLRPWLGYLMLLEDSVGSSVRPVSVQQPHFPVFEEFNNATYARRYELLLTRMLRDRLYDAASLLLTPRESGLQGAFSEPSEELSFSNFAESLLARLTAYARTRQ